MSSKVFGIGLSKTGTTSLYAALDELGYRSATYRHMRAAGLDRWFEGDFAEDYLASWDAVTDNPISVFYQELDRRYPGSRFILTLRDRDAWLASTRKQWSKHKQLAPAALAFRTRVRLAVYGITGWSESQFDQVYETHERNVRQYFLERPEDLLVMDVFRGDGWDRLCPFLGKSIPNVPFPNVKPGHRARPAPTRS
jgi:hypothetical protein